MVQPSKQEKMCKIQMMHHQITQSQTEQRITLNNFPFHHFQYINREEKENYKPWSKKTMK